MSNKGAKIYGYSVLLVAVITFLIATTNFIGSFFDLSDPLHAQSYRSSQESLASFETYKMDILKSSRSAATEGDEVYIPDEDTLRGMYQAALDDRISTVSLDARRTMTVSGILMIISIALFLFHWFWIRKF